MMDKDIYRLLNNTNSEIPQEQPLTDSEVNHYMKDFRQRTNPNTKNRNSFKYRGIIAASLALIMTIGGTIGYHRFTTPSTNPFIMTVNAEELMPNNTLISTPQNYGLAISERDDGRIVYCLDFTLECKGDNIQSVTYTLDKDNIGIFYRNHQNPVIKGTEATDTEFNDNAENGYTKKAYTSVTFDYNNQTPEGFTFEIFGIGDDSITADKTSLFSYDSNHLKEKCNVMDRLINNTVHCTAEYTDGTTMVQDIKIGTTISTLSEVFLDEYDTIPDNDKSLKNYRDVFVTYTATQK
ncbi:MAG: hypothetical protein IJU14_01540 [Clostridia bacterium]|nr:hypothetical protein [Clostridia bacterium]